MMTRTLLARCAPLAIAASAALPAIPAAAQDSITAEPVIVLPDPAPVAAAAPAPAPTIVLPEPVVEPAPVVAAPAEAAVAARAVAPRSAAPRTVTAPRAAAAAPAPALTRNAPAAVAATQAPGIAPAAAAEPAPVAQEAVATSSPNNDATGEVGLAALLGALGLGAVGAVAYAASRRRRRNATGDETLAYEPVTEEPVIAPAPAFSRTPEPMPAPVFTAPAASQSAFATPVVGAAPMARAASPASGDPLDLPAEVPESFEERDALLRELVAAEPDRANPFTSPRARARRAKLIMQSLGRSFNSRKPRFDLSEYTNRWPALRGWQPATA